MLNNKKVNVILSIIIAVCLWAYVIGETNPKASKTFHNVPIEFVNEDVLDSSNLAVLDVSSTILDVTLTGSRAKLNKVELEEISATVDLADAAYGKNELKINIKVPESMEVEEKSLNKVTVNVQRKSVKTVEVVPYFSGDFAENQEPLVVETGRKEVTVSGAMSKVEETSLVRAVIPSSEVTDEMRTLSCALVPVNAEGVEVKNLKLDAKSTKVTTVLVSKKTVPLEVPVVDNSQDDVVRNTSVPKTVTIKGKAKDLDKIDKIKSRPVDITGLMEDKNIPVELDLPDGIQLSEQSFDMKLKVTIEKLSEKEFNFKSSDVEIRGLSEDYDTEFSDFDITVKVKGKKDIESLKKDNVKLYVDLSGLSEGEFDIDINADLNVSYASLEINPGKIKIRTIKK